MKNKRVEKEIKKESGSLISIIMNIALIIAALIFTISLFGMIGEIRRVYKNDKGSSTSLTYYLEDDDFGSMVSTYFTRNAAVAPIDKDVKYLYDIAEYAHMVFIERIYEDRDEDVRAQRCRTKMQDIRNSLGEYGVAADKADEQLRDY